MRTSQHVPFFFSLHCIPNYDFNCYLIANNSQTYILLSPPLPWLFNTSTCMSQGYFRLYLISNSRFFFINWLLSRSSCFHEQHSHLFTLANQKPGVIFNILLCFSIIIGYCIYMHLLFQKLLMTLQFVWGICK